MDRSGDGPVWRYAARMGDTLEGLAETFRLPLSNLTALNPDLDAAAPLEPSQPVSLPLMEGEAAVRLERAGPLVAYASSMMRLVWETPGIGGPVLPLHVRDQEPSVRLIFRLDRTRPVGDGGVRGLVFAAAESDDPVGSLPVHAGTGRGRLPLLRAGEPPREAPPPVEEMRSEIERRGGRILRELAERGGERGRAIRVSLLLSPTEIIRAMPDEGRLRLWALCTDGYACDADRTDALGVLRLFVEYRSREAKGVETRPGLEVAVEGGGYDPVEAEDLGGEQRVEMDGERSVGVLPCPASGRLRIGEAREGTLDRCARDGDLALDFRGSLAPVEEHPISLHIYFRLDGDPPHFHRVCPGGEAVPREEYERERLRVQTEASRVVLLVEMTADGVRLAEAWLDGEPVPID